MTPRVEISKTLIQEADAIGTDLEFDSDGNLVSGQPEEESDEDGDDDS